MTTRPCWVEIRTRSLEENFRFLAALAAPHAELVAIVKADAYGHALNLCAPAVVQAGARWLGVTSVEEGVAARALAPEARILVIGGVFPGQGADVVRYGLTAVVWEQAQLDELESAAPGSLPVHLEIDTGMSRQGVAPDPQQVAFSNQNLSQSALAHSGLSHSEEKNASSLAQILRRFAPGSPLRLEAVMTHLFAADEADGRVTEAQFERVAEVLNRVEAAGLYPEWLNVGNSAALLTGQAAAIAALAARHGMRALARPGLALYGLVPEFSPGFDAADQKAELESLTAARARLQPVLAWKSRVVSLRSVPAGAVVGYNGSFVATEPMRLALVAVGYADGLDRQLGNRFSLLVRGQRAPLVGRVSMDQAVIDVTEIAGVQAGNEVVILGTQKGADGEETITAFDHAHVAETIPWEVFTRIGARVQRVEV